MDIESQNEKWNRGLDLFIESVYKPDLSYHSWLHAELQWVLMDYFHRALGKVYL